eukprot:1193792-Prorocentrum_minimum.AAC.2
MHPSESERMYTCSVTTAEEEYTLCCLHQARYGGVKPARLQLPGGVREVLPVEVREVEAHHLLVPGGRREEELLQVGEGALVEGVAVAAVRPRHVRYRHAVPRRELVGRHVPHLGGKNDLRQTTVSALLRTASWAPGPLRGRLCIL